MRKGIGQHERFLSLNLTSGAVILRVCLGFAQQYPLAYLFGGLFNNQLLHAASVFGSPTPLVYAHFDNEADKLSEEANPEREERDEKVKDDAFHAAIISQRPDVSS
jgi:hypothetical protein